ncbi:hypothetical protein BJY04DRAFT_216518 [Aspergillus karnatakaensis]|uniref:uncharacterized protein n=1 Tax=Aspergillus karnatakaensis TaxID=1810916 RepID=UPI003CCD577D
MCQKIYHHLAACEHIVSFTLKACAAFTNSLRTKTPLLGHVTRTSHKVLSHSTSEDTDCMQCQEESQQMSSANQDALISQPTECRSSQAQTEPHTESGCDSGYSTLEAIYDAGRMLTAEFMSLPAWRGSRSQGGNGVSTDGEYEMEDLCPVQEGTFLDSDSDPAGGFNTPPEGTVPDSYYSPLKDIIELETGWENDDRDQEYDFLTFAERSSSSTSSSFHDCDSEGEDGLLSAEYWTSLRSGLQSPTPGYDGGAGRFDSH